MQLCGVISGAQRVPCSAVRTECECAKQSYNEKGSLTTATFWRNGVLLAIVDAAVCFFFTYYSITTRNIHSVTDVYSVGKAAFIALLGAVTLEVCFSGLPFCQHTH